MVDRRGFLSSFAGAAAAGATLNFGGELFARAAEAPAQLPDRGLYVGGPRDHREAGGGGTSHAEQAAVCVQFPAGHPGQRLSLLRCGIGQLEFPGDAEGVGGIIEALAAVHRRDR